jgi:hypothetical protein
MYITVSVLWGILFITDTIQVWHACVLLVIHGMAGVLGAPGGQLIIHDIVGREYLQSAIRLNSTGRNLAVLFGPAVGGATMLLFGPPMGLFINALMYLPMIVFMFILPYTGHGRDEGMSGKPPPFGLQAAIKLAREASSNRTILSMILLGGATSFLVGNAFQVQMPEFAHDFGHDSKIYRTACCWAPMPPEPLSAVCYWKVRVGCGPARASPRFARCFGVAPSAVLRPLIAIRWRWACCFAPACSIWLFSLWRKLWCSLWRRSNFADG